MIGLVLSFWCFVGISQGKREEKSRLIDKYYEEVILVTWMGSGFLLGIAMGVPTSDVIALLTSITSLVLFFGTLKVRILDTNDSLLQ